MTIQVGYWNIRGLIGGVRLMLEYAGADWNETFYEAHLKEGGDRADFTNWDRTEWTNVKATAEFQDGFAFPNLPYLVDGDVKISQSTAMLKYIARKFDIGQKLNDTESWRVDQAADQIVDVRGGFVGLCYGFRTPFAQRETYCENTLKPQLKQLDRYMTGNNFVAGETLSYVDFMFWEILDHMELFDASLFNGLDNIKAFKKRFAELPKIAAYISSDKFMRGPCNNKMAFWGGDKELKRTW